MTIKVLFLIDRFSDRVNLESWSIFDYGFPFTCYNVKFNL